MDLGVKGKNAFVAAGSDGLGKAVALRLAAEGANIAICSRTSERVEAAVREIQAANATVTVHGFQVDLAKAEARSEEDEKKFAELAQGVLRRANTN